MDEKHRPLGFSIADPFLMRALNGRYYLYGTDETGGIFRCQSSEDLRSWRDEGPIYTKRSDGWNVDCFWAPECYYFLGQYYLFYSANWRHNPDNDDETFRIGVATAKDPTGPFMDLLDAPIFDPGYPIIDANVYAENGRYYLYYSRCCYKHRIGDLEESWIYGVEMREDFAGVIGEPVLLLRPEQPWENASAKETGRRWNEGSTVFKHAERYYMTYSANHFMGGDYAVGYAVSDRPLGPFVKAAENPILQKGPALSGTGHNSVLGPLEDGSYLLAYHGRTIATGHARMGFLSRAEVLADGRLVISQKT